ncbi:MAG: hypothetical protein HJJLKODD_00117 [Phycisphaerae bacterium]|nr:hypothetical protein [Phycisphaerae bacterium]
MLSNWLVRLWRDDRGASSVEYTLLVMLIAVFIILAMKTFGTAVSSRYDEAASAFTN